MESEVWQHGRLRGQKAEDADEENAQLQQRVASTRWYKINRLLLAAAKPKWLQERLCWVNMSMSVKE